MGRYQKDQESIEEYKLNRKKRILELLEIDKKVKGKEGLVVEKPDNSDKYCRVNLQ